MSARCVAPLLLAFLALVSAPAVAVAASPPPITARLDYTPAQGCPPASVLGGEFARRIGYEPFVESSPLLVVARITRRKGMLAGSLELYDAAGTLLWSTSTTPTVDCQELVVEMGSALAFRFDPHVYPSWLPGEPSPSPPSPPPPSPLPPPPPKEEARPVPIEPPAKAPAAGRVVVGLTPQLVLSTTGTAVGLIGALGWRWPFSERVDLSLGMEFRFDAPSSARVDDVRPGASVRAYLMGGSLLSCLHGLHLFGCAVAWGGALQITASGVDSSGSGHELGFVGGGARVGLEESFLPWLAFRAYGEILCSRPLQGLVNGAEVRGPSLLAFPLTGSLGLGLVGYFGGLR